jgi:lycopene cyclase domain-containing protein
MTYFGVLAVFILPPLLLLILFVPRNLWRALRTGKPLSRQDLLPYAAVLLHVVLAVVYTTPWDNYLVATGVWTYNPDLVTGVTLGYVPVEEYTFFVLQSMLTGLLTVAMMQRALPSGINRLPGEELDNPPQRWVSSLGVGAVWIASTALLFSGWVPGTYLALILSWALLPLLLQLSFGADILWHYRRGVLVSILAPTLYLWVVDALAITSGTWTIDPMQTTGLALGSLPVEEMLFFLMTNVIIVCGITLILAPESRPRLAWWRDKARKQTSTLSAADKV